ncbi:MAG: aminoacyl-histidine dipeptidase [Bacteroidales bacterium]|nr:aminoacyl-histidine dipeptidase [Bacteroidales bacterium]MCM1424264.1 aminoacyl-histidine dipeptidase [bacterium]
MGVLTGLQPERVFYYFEEISRIPHGSGNIGKISDYLRDFAKERGLFHVQDAYGNVIIVKEASAGLEKEEPYILQAHMDMVAVAEAGCGIDMKTEPLRLKTEAGKLYAEHTSLGGDDGIGVAYCLALLEAEDIDLPRLEIVLTADEETGMEGAKEIDLSMLRGRRMINLDQEEEGVFIVSCAGGARVDVDIPLKADTDGQEMRQLTLRVKGLLGGHSGIEIDRGRGNANRLLGSVLCGLSQRYDVRLSKMQGGQADNAIPREAEALVWVRKEDIPAIDAFLEAEEQKIRETLGEADPSFVLEKLYHNGTVCEACYTKESTAQALACLGKLPNGVIAMSEDVEGLVVTSLNLGVMSLREGGLRLSYAVRSSVDRAREELCEKMRQTAARAGAEAQIRNAYPGWAYRKESPLRDRMAAVYRELYGKEPTVQAIHAGLECGILAGKIADLDCVSIGPDLSHVHTAEERMDIASVGRVWEYLLRVLSVFS